MYLADVRCICVNFQSFKGMAKILGSVIQDREDLRMDVMASLRKLIKQNLDHGQY